ncbi:MAG: hypothetical protein IJO57_04310 [Bacilli bacterium]|nr:hypothetical protein [Bacilli bacterium]
MKKKLIILLLFLTLVYPLQASAEAFEATYTDTSDDENNSNGPNKPPTTDVAGFALGSYNGASYSCSYSYSANASTTLKIDIYNDKNESLSSKDSLQINEKIKAGTSIGIYANENKTVSYEVSNIKYLKSYKTYKRICVYSDNRGYTETKTKTTSTTVACESSIYVAGKGTIFRIYDSGRRSETNTISVNEAEVPSNYITKCKENAIKTAQNAAKALAGSSYGIRMNDSNDINAPLINTPDKGKEEVQFPSGALSASKTINYTYEMNNVCLDVKTARITYNKECGNNQIKVSNDNKNGKNHWHYFIPLNTPTSTDKIVIEFYKNSPISEKKCKNVIKDNKNTYRELIAPKDNSIKYTGNVANDEIIIKTENGCKLISTITIPVIQEFYAEQKNAETKNVTLQGNKFYFRRIDIQKPFNYKITDPNSLWYEWYNANYDSENEYSMNKVKPNISASFNKVLYYTQNNNIRDIRKYNSIMKYYDWTEMKKNGESCLISDQNGGTNCDSNTAQGLSIAQRNFNSGDDGTPYKLGHGPESTICTVGDKEVAYIGAKECENAG